METIPVIDLNVIVNSQPNPENLEVWKNVASEIRSALSGIGFMYLKNHRIGNKTITDAFEASSKFFHLPTSVKSKYKKNHEVNGSGHGWVEAGQELLHPDSVFELRECFDIVGHRPERKYPCREQHPDFGEAMEKLESEANELIVKLLKLLGFSLELEDSDYFINCCRHLNNNRVTTECDLRAIYYPAIPEKFQIPTGTVRCAEHTDYEILTLLFQDDVGGLEVKNIDGKWISATPIKDTILVNTGDLLQFWTNGFYPATYHRVVIPDIEIQKRNPRYSIAYFFAPDDETLISPLNSTFCLEDTALRDAKENCDSVPTITAHQHIMNRVKEAYQY